MTAFNSRDGGFFLTTVGRVQTPTLSVVVEREEKIRKFISRDYWEIHATFGAEGRRIPRQVVRPWKFKTRRDAGSRADRVWERARGAGHCRRRARQAATVTEESKPTTQARPLLFDLTSLQREANGKFGFAKTTLALAQSLYERHKALTYPRTDSRATCPRTTCPWPSRPSRCWPTACPCGTWRPARRQALNKGYIKPTKRIFDNSKVSDHFAIIPTLQRPSRAESEAEQKLYDLVVRRFMAVFFPERRIPGHHAHHRRRRAQLQDRRQGAGQAGLAGHLRQGSGREVAVARTATRARPGAGEARRDGAHRARRPQGPARPSRPRATPKPRCWAPWKAPASWIDDDELREAMQEKGLGTPATRAPSSKAC
jgi:DNA topoisomerase-3